MKHTCKLIAICMLCAVTAYAQFDSPAPPRIQITGAILTGGGGGRQGALRQGRLQAAPIPLGAPRIRRPGLARPSFKSVDAAPRPNLQLLDEISKPVTEEPEDDIDINTPTAFINSYSTPEPQNDYFDITTTSQPKPPAVFNSSPYQQNSSPYQQTTPTAPKPEPVRPTQYRPLPPQSFSPVRNEPPQRPQPARLQPLSSRPQRPAFRPEPKPYVDEEDDGEYVQPVRQTTRQQPAKNVQKYIPTSSRDKKPVAQIIRKYREENEDGSITWGFENDDGSFKEETIGVDCRVHGKYGYIDPDGVKREYNYDTGLACDKTKEDKEQKGFIDYQENKAILPNGITIDLNAMGKKSKRPFRSAGNN